MTEPIADPDSIEAKAAAAEAVLTGVLRQGHPVCPCWSSGKDSSTMLNLLLCAAARMKQAGEVVPAIFVIHADTGIENPEMVLYARNEMTQVRNFAQKHGLRVGIDTAHPTLLNTWGVRVISGRALPPFPGQNRDCTTDWKIKPMKKLRGQVLRALAKEAGPQNEPVLLLGTRFDESTTRGSNMRSRGESAVTLVRGTDENGKPSHLFLSPIAHWSTDDVWEYLGLARSEAIDSYSDFDETFRVYADAMGSSCVIIGEDMSTKQSSKACGARHGCSLCTLVQADRSMENMLTLPRYAYMQGLNDLRNFISATRWDMSRRHWIGRTINNGWATISPDTYSPAMMEELLRYCLTIDQREQKASQALGIRPRFQLISIDQLFAIDAMWSLQALHKPFHALSIYKEVVMDGKQYDVPNLAVVERPVQLPAPRYLWVGEDWDQGEQREYTGLRSVMSELAAGDFGGGCMPNKSLKNGLEVLDLNIASMFDINVESAYMVLDFELDELLSQYHDAPNCCPTEGYMYYVRLGLMTIKSGLESEVDSILRRSHFKFENGLHGHPSHELLISRSISAADKKTLTQVGAVAPQKSAGDDEGTDALPSGDSHQQELFA